MDLSKRLLEASSAHSIAALFEAQVAELPDAPALRWEDESLSYAALNQRANQLAARLRDLGAGPDALIGIFLDRSFDLVAGILGILKSGAAYLPLDLACPADRLSFLLADSNAGIVLTMSSLKDKLSGYKGKIIFLDSDHDLLSHDGMANLPCLTEPHHLAYVIYTSGSTGQPKGVMVTQENVLRLFSTTDGLFHFGPEDVWTLFHSSAFDFSVWEIFGALLYGGCLVIVPYMVSRSASAFHELLVRERVTVLNQTPSAFRQLIEADQAAAEVRTSLRYVIFGGEALDYQCLRPWFARHGVRQPQLVNMYGITETTVHVTHHAIRLIDLDRGGSNIGRPLPDLQVHLVNGNDEPVATGEIGEMLVGGLGVARGYLYRPELTAQRFVEDRFVPGSTGRLYRSGDLARRRENGDLEYLGRSDHQVKIRGFRVELPEIESVLGRHPAIRECAVISRAESGAEPRLVAYLALRANAGVDVETLRSHLAQTLPDYMVPSDFVFLPEFPLTINGKLDRAALPAPGSQRPPLASPFVAPESDLEQLLAGLWHDALRRDTIGTDDNFFDLGGDSLLLTALHRQMQIELKRELPITDLFQFPTIRALAAHLGRSRKSTAADASVENRAQQQRAALLRARQAAAPPSR